MYDTGGISKPCPKGLSIKELFDYKNSVASYNLYMNEIKRLFE